MRENEIMLLVAEFEEKFLNNDIIENIFPDPDKFGEWLADYASRYRKALENIHG